MQWLSKSPIMCIHVLAVSEMNNVTHDENEQIMSQVQYSTQKYALKIPDTSPCIESE